jgi:hypothetical protein
VTTSEAPRGFWSLVSGFWFESPTSNQRPETSKLGFFRTNG